MCMRRLRQRRRAGHWLQMGRERSAAQPLRPRQNGPVKQPVQPWQMWGRQLVRMRRRQQPRRAGRPPHAARMRSAAQERLFPSKQRAQRAKRPASARQAPRRQPQSRAARQPVL